MSPSCDQEDFLEFSFCKNYIVLDEGKKSMQTWLYEGRGNAEDRSEVDDPIGHKYIGLYWLKKAF